MPGNTSAAALDLRWQPDPEAPALCELLHACLDDFAPVAIQDRETSDGWRVFFRTSAERDRAAAAIKQTFATELEGVQAIDVADEDWARRSQAGLRAIHVGRIVVSPPWDVIPASLTPDPGSRLPAITIVIDPSTGFGTGHHETTRLCLGILQTLEVAGRRTIDIGTGSGVLAIAAAKLHASAVVAIDNDPDALENARDNIRRNGCSSVIDIYDADVMSLATEPADIVTANLTGAVLARNASRLMGLLKPGGTVIVSGFGPEEVSTIVSAFSPLSECGAACEGDWVAIALRASG